MPPSPGYVDYDPGWAIPVFLGWAVISAGILLLSPSRTPADAPEGQP